MKATGGPAFPREDYQANGGGGNTFLGQEGMTLRDYFAAHAPAMTEQWFKDSGGALHWLEAEASWRYAYADAMLAERVKP